MKKPPSGGFFLLRVLYSKLFKHKITNGVASLLSESQQEILKDAESYLSSAPQNTLKKVMGLMSEGIINGEIWGLCGKALFLLEQFEQGVVAFKRALDYQPDNQGFLIFLAKGYLALSDFTGLELLYENNQDLFSLPENVHVAILVLESLSRNDEVLCLLKKCLKKEPDNAEVNSALAWSYQTLGRMTEAENFYRKAIQLTPNNINTRYLLSQLRKYSLEDNNTADLEALLTELKKQEGDYREIHAALAKEYEDTKEYDKAIAHLVAVATCVKKSSRHSAKGDNNLFKSVKSWAASAQASGSNGGFDDESPVFIVGMPRTGSTLVDSILSNHSMVQSLGELGCFRSAFQQICKDTRGDFFEQYFGREYKNLNFSAVGERYMRMLDPLRNQSMFFTDKLPMNYVFLGLIALSLPKAKFIHTCRNPMDTCFSNYKMMFGKGYYEYSYDLESLGQHYVGYKDLMAFWHRSFPGRIYDLHYEGLVTKPESEVHALLGFLGLDWEDSCLEFYKKKEAVKTASISQVRQPIYRGSVDKWRKFDKHLQPLILFLKDKGIAID